MNLLKKLIGKKVYIISPHFDDAMLSCGGLILQIRSKCNLKIINIFTKAHKGPYTLSAKRFLKISGSFKDATVLFKSRNMEDKSVFTQLGIKTINLGFEDSLFRRKTKSKFFGKILPEMNHIYPTYRWHVLGDIKNEENLFNGIRKKLAKFAKKDEIAIVPSGIGNHVDHLIARELCEKLFKNLVFYSDFPYSLRDIKKRNFGKEYKTFELKVNYEEKDKCLRKYKTQYANLFSFYGGKMPDHKEIFFFKK